jgi:hypothetical protein
MLSRPYVLLISYAYFHVMVVHFTLSLRVPDMSEAAVLRLQKMYKSFRTWR